jgi:transcription initiation factor TFIIF subunit beta
MTFFLFHQGYLKEILSEFCKYNQSGTHKSTWELKPEYRHYEPHEPQNNDMDVDD